MIKCRVLLQSVAAAAPYSSRSFRPTWAAIIAVCGMLAVAPASAQGVKIGVLNDQSGTYADYGGKWIGRSREEWRSRTLAEACSAKR